MKSTIELQFFKRDRARSIVDRDCETGRGFKFTNSVVRSLRRVKRTAKRGQRREGKRETIAQLRELATGANHEFLLNQFLKRAYSQ